MYALLPQTALYHLDPFIFIGEQSRQMYPLAFNSTHEEFHSIPLSTFDYSPVKSVYFKKWHIVKGYRFSKDKHDNHLNYSLKLQASYIHIQANTISKWFSKNQIPVHVAINAYTPLIPHQKLNDESSRTIQIAYLLIHLTLNFVHSH